MQINKGSRGRHRGEFLLLCAIVSASGVIAGSFISKSRPESSARRSDGFDFSQHANYDWSGPRVGERIDLRRFVGRAGKRLAGATGGDILMLASVDPDCAAGRESRDQLAGVRERMARAHIPYLLVSFTTNRQPADFFGYVDSLDVAAPAYIWETKDGAPPEQLATMVVPSHLLVKQDGTILRTWPGTSPSRKVRSQMADQIVADAIEITAAER